MFAREHDPPHFHAIYGSHQAEVGIDPIAIVAGSLPNRARSMVFEWAAVHQAELMENWNRLRRQELPARVEPLDWGA